jgi:threonylcarbamoyladenosine tRNA methylthiotransferase MtaB
MKWIFLIYTFLLIPKEIIQKQLKCLMLVPMNVEKRSKMLRGLSVKKRRAFYESQIGTNRTVLFESENKEGYIHGFTENYVKVKTPWNPELVNTLHEINLTKIDEDGSVRMEFINVEA